MYSEEGALAKAGEARSTVASNAAARLRPLCRSTSSAFRQVFCKSERRVTGRHRGREMSAFAKQACEGRETSVFVKQACREQLFASSALIIRSGLYVLDMS